VVEDCLVALKARGEYRRGRYRDWLPDIEQELDLPDMHLPLDFDPGIDASEWDAGAVPKPAAAVARLKRDETQLTAINRSYAL